MSHPAPPGGAIPYAFVSAFVATVVMCWVYFSLSAQRTRKVMARGENLNHPLSHCLGLDLFSVLCPAAVHIRLWWSR